jgi:hypothetical protein
MYNKYVGRKTISSDHIITLFHFNMTLPLTPISSLFHNQQINNEQSLLVQYIGEDAKLKINVFTKCKTFNDS